MSDMKNTTIIKPKTEKKTFIKRKIKTSNIYTNVMINRKIILDIAFIGDTLKSTLENVVKSQIEGLCINEGFVKPDSVRLLSYSSGILSGSNVIFETVFECKVCCPVEGLLIECVTKNVTKAGIRAETNDEPSPVVIFISRDHNYTSSYFNNVKEDETITVRVIGQRYELNDKYISIIAEIIEPPEEKLKKKKVPKLVIKDTL
tara:strand:+ start:1632 stop:2240 length:609 start_codon:yes stop_codon:yes gene_type:complete